MKEILKIMFRKEMEFIEEKIICTKGAGWMGKCMGQGRANGIMRISRLSAGISGNIEMG